MEIERHKCFVLITLTNKKFYILCVRSERPTPWNRPSIFVFIDFVRLINTNEQNVNICQQL